MNLIIPIASHSFLSVDCSAYEAPRSDSKKLTVLFDSSKNSCLPDQVAESVQAISSANL